MPSFDFSAKTILVTGASTGIGRATAQAFAAAGGRVVAFARNEAALVETAAGSERIRIVVGDVTIRADVARAVEQTVAFGGGLDVLVNNAGIYAGGSIGAGPEGVAEQLVAINLFGVGYATEATLPNLAAARGAIINVGSALGHLPAAGGSFYAASKAAVESLTRSWAAEFAARGIRVNAIAPGPVDSGILLKAGLTAEQVVQSYDRLADRLPLKRVGRPEEIAHWIMALAAPEASWITGQILSVDGGMSVM